MILSLFLRTLLTVSSNLEELRGLEELIVELRMDILQRSKGEVVKMIERGMTVPSVGNQFLTIELKPGEVYWEKTVLDGGRQQELWPLSWQWLCWRVSQVLFHAYIARSLHREVGPWNLHRIRSSTNLKFPSGRPDVLFFFPEVSGTRNYTVDVDLDELDLAEERCCYQPPQRGCSDELTQLSEIMRGKRFIISSHTWRGNNFVCHLTRRNN